MQTPQIFKGKKFPKFITNHLIFKAFPEVDKIFPQIGLANCRGKLLIDDNVREAIAKSILNESKNKLESVYIRPSYNLNGMIAPIYYSKHNEHNIVKRIIRAVMATINTNKNSLTVNKNIISFILPEEIKIGTFTLNKGKDVFSELNKLDVFSENKKFFLTKNYLKKLLLTYKNDIVFSSNNLNGIWDIATMSMRGIHSCQSWRHRFKIRLIGSIADPYTGIIYSTKGKTRYGSKMLTRAVVRFVLGSKNKKPALFVEEVYTHKRYLSSQDELSTEALKFIAFLKQKTNNKFDVIYYNSRGYFIPLSEKVAYLSDDNRSYRDSEIAYRAIKKDLTKLSIQ